MSTSQINPIPPDEPDYDPDQAMPDVTTPPDDGGPLIENPPPPEDADDLQEQLPQDDPSTR